MTDVMENIMRNNLTVGDVKCRTELSVASSAPGDTFGKLSSSRGGNDVGGDIEQLERKKKPRRRKAKRKNPYSKQMTENRGGKKNFRLRAGKSTYEQPVAPYNSNQFLIEDHNDLQDFDIKLMAAANRGSEQQIGSDLGPTRTGRVRDPSFTSAESDEDFFYSSPEDEEEFLTKEFSNTYRDLHVEGLASMSKAELIQTIIQLEEKVDKLQKYIEDKSTEEDTNRAPEKIHNYQSEIARLLLANQKLASENARLREVRGKCCSSSSEDSESDSTSSSESSDMNTSVDDDETPNRLPYEHMNGDVHKENDINMDPTDNT